MVERPLFFLNGQAFHSLPGLHQGGDALFVQLDPLMWQFGFDTVHQRYDGQQERVTGQVLDARLSHDRIGQVLDLIPAFLGVSLSQPIPLLHEGTDVVVLERQDGVVCERTPVQGGFSVAHDARSDDISAPGIQIGQSHNSVANGLPLVRTPNLIQAVQADYAPSRAQGVLEEVLRQIQHEVLAGVGVEVVHQAIVFLALTAHGGKLSQGDEDGHERAFAICLQSEFSLASSLGAYHRDVFEEDRFARPRVSQYRYALRLAQPLLDGNGCVGSHTVSQSITFLGQTGEGCLISSLRHLSESLKKLRY